MLSALLALALSQGFIGPVPGINVTDESSLLGRTQSVVFVGAGVTCLNTLGIITCTIAGGSGSANVVEAEVDFGASPGKDTASVVVTGQAWVTTTSVIVCQVTMTSTADRADGAEDAVIEGITVTFSTRVLATGFTLVASPALGNAVGKYKVHCTGA